MELSEEFKLKMKDLLGDNLQAFLDSLNSPEQKGITANFSRISKDIFESVADFPLSPVPMINNGYYVDSIKFAQNKFNHIGVIYSQEPSAMYPVELLDIQPEDIVLDLCASPGGKSIQILEKLNNTGILISNEINFSRNKILYENLSRMGFKNSIITCDSPETFSHSNILFDKIIVDAPCGGEGMIRKSNFDPNAFSSLSIETNAKRQLSILNSIKGNIKTNGILVYSTCTYDMRENEMVIAKFIEENPEFEIVETIDLTKCAERGIKIGKYNTQLGYRRYPHLHNGEGQFMIALQYKGINENAPKSKFKTKIFQELNKKELDEINRTLKSILPMDELKFLKRNDTIYVVPNTQLDLSNLNITNIGCVLGNYSKGILKLSHSFYHTYGNEFFNKIEINEKQFFRLIHGEEIETDKANGICCLTHLGIPISGGKITNGKIKNNYPKELRI